MADKDYSAQELAEFFDAPVEKVKLWLRDEGVEPIDADVESEEDYRYRYSEEDLEFASARFPGV